MQTITHLVIEVPASKLREAREIYRDCLGSTPGGLPSPRQLPDLGILAA